MNKTTEAMVLSYYDNPNELNQKIKELIGEGWQLQGGTSVCEADRQGGGRTLVYAQAMVKTLEVVGFGLGSDDFIGTAEAPSCVINCGYKQRNCSPEVEPSAIPAAYKGV